MDDIEKNTHHLMNQQALANENAMLRSRLKKAGVDRIHRENQNIYDSAHLTLENRAHAYHHGYYHPHNHWYPSYVEPPPVIEKEVIVKKSSCKKKHH
mmetsp:Transcript_25389/g.25125  ORF Transcript_25389/g.25125 Transcript_25389/m.25125 type:complete len:97 (+) Transcript_25389:238-528(+)